MRLDTVKVFFNPFSPEFLMWTLPSLNLGMPIIANRVLVENKNRMANSVDSDEMISFGLQG